MAVFGTLWLYDEPSLFTGDDFRSVRAGHGFLTAREAGRVRGDRIGTDPPGVGGVCGARANRRGGSAEVIDRITSASVKVTLDKDGRRLGSGSGVVVASRIEGSHAEAVSYVLTAQHVLDGKDGSAILVYLTGVDAARVKKLSATLYRKGDAGRSILRCYGFPVLAGPGTVP